MLVLLLRPVLLPAADDGAVIAAAQRGGPWPWRLLPGKGALALRAGDVAAEDESEPPWPLLRALPTRLWLRMELLRLEALLYPLIVDAGDDGLSHTLWWSGTTGCAYGDEGTMG